MVTSPPARTWLHRLLGRTPHRPTVPEGIRVYAVGDIHGRDDLLAELLDSIRDHAGERGGQNCLIFLGDYVDRGLESKAVIERLLDLDFAGWDIVWLRGNHDQTVLDFLDDPAVYRAWRSFGAAETLVSYGVMPPKFDNDEAYTQARDAFVANCPERHLEFLRSLKYSHILGDYMFVHAGVRPGVPLAQQSPEDMMWIRDDFLMSQRAFGKVVVHGHSPTELPVRRFNRIGVDTGAYATGRLTAAVLEGETCDFLSTPGAPGIGKVWQENCDVLQS